MNMEYGITKKTMPWLFSSNANSLYYYIYTKASEGDMKNEGGEWIGMIRSVKSTFKRELAKSERQIQKVMNAIKKNGTEGKANNDKIKKIVKLLAEKKILPKQEEKKEEAVAETNDEKAKNT